VTDLNWPANPYDYSSPAKRDAFAGRAIERAKLERFASATALGDVGHLLIHGRRGIGKTSLLGRLDEALDNRAVTHATVTLDDISASEQGFLPEAILGLTNAVIEAGGFGGPEGQYVQSVQNTLLGAPATGTDGPLRVLTFVAARGTGSRIPDLLVSQDLEELVDGARDVDSPGLVLTIDEADRLAAHPVTIQRLRNLLISPGLISTVLCGSDALLAALDSAAAPYSRHYVRIQLQALADERETSDAIWAPLRSAGAIHPVLVTPELVREVHALTGGRPFEIALLCHAMYESITQTKQPILALSDRVLDAVTEQLRPSTEDMTALAGLRSLDPEDLRRVARYCVDPQLTVHDHALLQTAFAFPAPQTIEAARASVRAEWQHLETMGLAVVESETLRPCFSELGRLYLKYKARAQGVFEPAFEGRYSERFAGKLDARIANILPGSGPVVGFLRARFALVEGDDPEMTLRLQLLRGKDFDGAAKRPLFLYPRDPRSTEHGAYLLVHVPFEINEDGFASLQVAVQPSEGALPGADVLASITTFVREAEPYGIKLGRPAYVEMTAAEWDYWRRCETYSVLASVLAAAWMSGGRDVSRKLVVELAEELEVDVDAQPGVPESGLGLLNNAGFVLLSAGELENARTLFERAAVRGGLAHWRNPIDRAVLLCNLAASSAGMGLHDEALDWCDQVDALMDELGGAVAGVLIAFSPNPDWANNPLVVDGPDPILVSMATRAGVLSARGDQAAIPMATAVLDRTSANWARRLLRDVAHALDRPDAVELAGEDSGDESREFDIGDD
jgi:hypothetical protein